MLVDSMATVVTPQAFSQSAMASRSQVLVPNLRTPAGSFLSGLTNPAGTSSGATATKCTAPWMSSPAACRCVIARSPTVAAPRLCLRVRAMTYPPRCKLACWEKNAARAGGRIINRLQNGDFRRSRGDATNEVIANSRDQAHLRVKTPLLNRPLQRAAKIGYNSAAVGGKVLEPKYRLQR